MERIAIIDHTDHCLYIEDISDEVLKRYNNEEELFIEDMYCLKKGTYSWDYITGAYYMPEDLSNDPLIEINFKELI